ncbi:MAG TPA: antitoxin [Aldersonia sp.]
MSVQDTTTDLYEKGKALVLEGLDKGKQLLVDNADKITEAVDNVGGFIDDKTGHKYTETITKGTDAVKKVIPTPDEAPAAAPEEPVTPTVPNSD